MLFGYKKKYNEQLIEVAKLKAELSVVTKENKHLSSKLDKVIDEIDRLEVLSDLALNEELENLNFEKEQVNADIAKLEKYRENLKQEVISLEDLQEDEGYGLYVPKYNFLNSIEYKDELGVIRGKQKELIKYKKAVIILENWVVNGSEKEGQKLTNDLVKQLLRMFNLECEVAISKATFKNIDSKENRILKVFEQLNKLNISNKIELSEDYLKLKLKELYLSYEYAKKVEQEKEELRMQREQAKEDKLVQQELEAQKQKIEKDITQYKKQLCKLEDKYSNEYTKDADLLAEIERLKALLDAKEVEKQRVSTFEVAQAGYVYVISNIGAFGKDVYKIGVTRRLEPYKRIDELGSASVPFKFDVHALLFSTNAFGLEKELHTYFDKYRVNKVNNRKEFFKVGKEELDKKLFEYKHSITEYYEEPTAEEYRGTLELLGKKHEAVG